MRRNQRKIKFRSQVEKSDYIQDFRASRLGMSEFCRQKGIPVSTFSWWLKKESESNQDKSSRPKGFVELPLRQVILPDIPDDRIEIQTRQGLRIRLPKRFDTETVRKLLEGLEGL